MARLPNPGGDVGTWGEVLNDYLSQSLTQTGSIKPDAISSSQLANNSVTSAQLAPGSVNSSAIASGAVAETQLSSGVQAKLNASASGGATSYNDLTDKPTIPDNTAVAGFVTTDGPTKTAVTSAIEARVSQVPQGPAGPQGESGLTAHPTYAGVQFYVGPGPLPEPGTMPNTIYILIPEV